MSSLLLVKRFVSYNFLAKNYLILAKKSSILAVIILSVFFISKPVIAENDQEMTSIYIPAGTVYNDILFIAGENIDINAQMSDDVYAAGANVILSGLVEGDVIAVGANVQINAEVRGNVRVAGASVTIKGNVAGNVTVLAGELTIDDNITVGRNLLFAGGSLKQNGQLSKNLYAAGGNLILNNQINGSAYIVVDPDGILVLYPKTNILGNLEYTAKQKAEIKEGAQIHKQEKFSQFQPKTAESRNNFFKAWFGIAWFIRLLGSIVIGLVLISLFKDFTQKIVKSTEDEFLISLLKGFIFLVVTPVALIILAVTVIGLPLAIICLTLYLILVSLAKIFFSVYLGDKVIRLIKKDIKEVPLIWVMILGLVLLYILFALPILGILVKFFVCLAGLGVLLTVLNKELKLHF